MSYFQRPGQEPRIYRQFPRPQRPDVFPRNFPPPVPQQFPIQDAFFRPPNPFFHQPDIPPFINRPPLFIQDFGYPNQRNFNQRPQFPLRYNNALNMPGVNNSPVPRMSGTIDAPTNYPLHAPFQLPVQQVQRPFNPGGQNSSVSQELSVLPSTSSDSHFTSSDVNSLPFQNFAPVNKNDRNEPNKLGNAEEQKSNHYRHNRSGDNQRRSDSWYRESRHREHSIDKSRSEKGFSDRHPRSSYLNNKQQRRDSSYERNSRKRRPSPPGEISITPNRKNISQRNDCHMELKDSVKEKNMQREIESSSNSINEERIRREAIEWESLLENYEEEKVADWVRCSPADLFFKRNPQTGIVQSTKKMQDLEKVFESELLKRSSTIRSKKPPVVMPERFHQRKYKSRPKNKAKSSADLQKEKKSDDDETSDDDDDSCLDDNNSSDDESEDRSETSNKMDIIHWKNQHPEKLHEEMWFNLPGEMNDGPLCRCSSKTKLHGIRHNIYPGEQNIKKCDAFSSNSDKLFHYKITMSPHTNFLTKNPTLIFHDGHEYIFEGFSLFSHYKLVKVPTCKVIRFNIEYTIHWFEEDMIENFDIKSLDQFSDFLYGEILELLDLNWVGKDCDDCCRCFHVMPRFSRGLPENGKEILSMNEVLKFMLESNKALIDEMQLGEMLRMSDHEWQDFVDEVRGMIVSYPGRRPSSLRIDQLDRAQSCDDVIQYPKIIHFGYRPAQLSYVGDTVYSKLFKQYMKLKYLVANKPKLTLKDREKLRQLEDQLQEIRLKGSLKREMTVELNSEGFVRTGLKSDICQHALLLPVLLQHLRFHKCLEVLEDNIGYRFKDRLFLQMAMTHPSFRMNYGTNPDHARNSLSNCGMRQLEYGNRHIHYMHTRKRGIKTLMHIMSKMARAQETASEIHHYERLEFLGDTVIEFLSSIHLFFLFPRLEEGGLATYRAALVQNQHLTVLAQKLGLQHFLLYAHGPDLCRDLDLRYALANCFEALLGSLFLDGGIEVADRIFGEALFKDEPNLLDVWKSLPAHPLQGDEPLGDRHWISKSKPLQKLVKFEDETGFQFNHIRLLARAFTMRNIGFNNLTLGHNQTLEFLGDTILQFVTSDYLFKHFPDHHEGHLTLLRSSLVNNKTQAIICDDLGMTEYVINNDPKVKERMENEKNKVKDKADILEAFIGSLYVDQGLDPCLVFCQVCFYPRLKEFIMNQDWNDAKSQLQQCCLTLRDPTDGEPDIPVYKVLQCTGPTNTRKYHVAVYFRGERLATGIGHSIQQGEMNAAANALKEKSDMFPHLLQTKQYLDWRFGRSLSKNQNKSQFMDLPAKCNSAKSNNSDHSRESSSRNYRNVTDEPSERSSEQKSKRKRLSTGKLKHLKDNLESLIKK